MYAHSALLASGVSATARFGLRQLTLHYLRDDRNGLVWLWCFTRNAGSPTSNSAVSRGHALLCSDVQLARHSFHPTDTSAHVFAEARFPQQRQRHRCAWCADSTAFENRRPSAKKHSSPEVPRNKHSCCYSDEGSWVISTLVIPSTARPSMAGQFVRPVPLVLVGAG